jgi:hypothetical protein
MKASKMYRPVDAGDHTDSDDEGLEHPDSEEEAGPRMLSAPPTKGRLPRMLRAR